MTVSTRNDVRQNASGDNAEDYSSTENSTQGHASILARVNIPADMRTLSDEQIKQLAHEVRQQTIDAVSKTGGHLGAGLGVVELTVAIHAVFNTPEDKLIWDVGHQCYPHKIITGRRDRITTLRQGGGLSASPNVPNPPMTRSAPPTAAPPSRRASAWRWRAISQARITM